MRNDLPVTGLVKYELPPALRAVFSVALYVEFTCIFVYVPS